MRNPNGRYTGTRGRMGSAGQGRSSVVYAYDSVAQRAASPGAAASQTASFVPATGAGSYTNSTGRTLTVHAYVWGAGAQVLSVAQGPSGANAGYKKLRMAPGDVLGWNIGNLGIGPTTGNGPDSTLTLPDATVLTARGGRTSGVAQANAGAWDESRLGGAGGLSAGAGSNSPSPGGSSGNASSSGFGGSGGTAGFADVSPNLYGGTPGNTNGGAPGGNAPGGSVNTNAHSAWMGGVRIFAVDEGE